MAALKTTIILEKKNTVKSIIEKGGGKDLGQNAKPICH